MMMMMRMFGSRYLSLKNVLQTQHFHRPRFSSTSTNLEWPPSANPGKSVDPVEQSKSIRNIGFVAHIDAGKTTTTERILYFSGFSQHMGEVHNGDTIMDFMEQERERGITITMAAAIIRWNGYHIHLLDTPGHVDFTFEVERSLFVLDGSVVILDASAGVQAQTMKVWQQVRKYQIPTVFYLNKMDKPTASVEKCLASIERKLKVPALLLQKACWKDSTFTGIIDLVDGSYMEWSGDPKDPNLDAARFRTQRLFGAPAENDFLPKSQLLQYQHVLQTEREHLINQLCDHDDRLADHVLSLDQIDQVQPHRLMESIRSQCIERRLCPVVLGSSYRNVGVQPLLDSVCAYLPEPLEKESNRQLYDHYTKLTPNKPADRVENLCALAFKMHYHPRLGLLTYLRIYSGSLINNMMVYNLNRKSVEKIQKIYVPFADNFAELKIGGGHCVAGVGSIVAVAGLDQTVTGDTLVHSTLEPRCEDVEDDSVRRPVLTGLEIPEPVFYCSLECSSISKMKQLQIALEHLQREDPSLRVVNDPNNQQLIIKGMGELHIEIIKERIRREFGVQVETGPLQVSYKETISNSSKVTMEQSKTIGSQLNQVKITIQVIPKAILEQESNQNDQVDEQSWTAKKSDPGQLVKIINTKTNNLVSQLKPWQLKAIQTGVIKALEYGPLFAFTVVGVQVAVHEFETSRQTSPPFIANIVAQAVLSALRKAGPILMEPIMRVEIVTPERYVGMILSDLSNRRSQLASADDHANDSQNNNNNNSYDDQERNIVAYVPLAEMFNYSTVLRTISSGMASLEMTLHSYKPMDELTTVQVIRKISGIE